MPNYYVFHQNLRVFAGTNARRNTAFEDAMDTISTDIGSDRVLVAGFTEVMNNQNTRTPLRRIAQELDAALRTPILFATGTTAVGNQTEWVGISTHTNFTVQISGKVLKQTNNTWQAYPVTPQLPADQMPPGNFAADVRGLAYVGGTIGNQRLLFGFIHNNYTLGEPSTIYRALPQMVTAIGQAHQGWDQVTRYLGGDFNIRPDDIGVGYRAVYATDEDMGEIKTTWYHTYDYWITNNGNIDTGQAEVFTASRWENDPDLSDHAGVGLQILST
ncbi:MAG TPA: hypothetical protein VK191_16510 [Symbiobacteriaceae bacterium]|nr:hypothetical protein [Symbiobacteriaceae bacterium]